MHQRWKTVAGSRRAARSCGSHEVKLEEVNEEVEGKKRRTCADASFTEVFMFSQQLMALELGVEREFQLVTTPQVRHIPPAVGLRITSMTTLAVQEWPDGTTLVEPRHRVAATVEEEADLLLGAMLDESRMLTLVGDHPREDCEVIRWRVMALLTEDRGGPRTLHRALTPTFAHKVSGRRRYWPAPAGATARERALLKCMDNLIRVTVAVHEFNGQRPLEQLLASLIVGTQNDPRNCFIAEYAAQASDGLKSAGILKA